MTVCRMVRIIQVIQESNLVYTIDDDVEYVFDKFEDPGDCQVERFLLWWQGRIHEALGPGLLIVQIV